MKGTTIKNKLSDGSEIEMTIKLRRAENRREVPEDILLEEITGAFQGLLFCQYQSKNVGKRRRNFACF